jgi:WD repeat-containing protein 44
MDKTVRLWHVTRSECLCCFKHGDVVTSIQFHPRDDRFFVAGSLDTKLRLWSIPDKVVAYWEKLSEVVTAVEFTPDGKTVIAGTLTGQCGAAGRARPDRLRYLRAV